MHLGADGSPGRWNPCQPIPYFVNPVGMPAGVQPIVAEAFARLSAFTGITFVDSGGTDVVYGSAVGMTFDRGLGIYVAFADETVVPGLAGTIGGRGGPMFYEEDAAKPRYVAGAIIIDTGGGMGPGFSSGWSYGSVILHELGHVMGLAHVNDRTQLMNPSNGPGGPTDMQAGDRAGLQAMLAGGCF